MNIKELKKLASEVGKASQFATQIQNQVKGDLERLGQLNTYVSETKAQVLEMEQRISEANGILAKLNALLE